MNKLSITTLNLPQFLENCNKVLAIVDDSKISKSIKSEIHSLIDLKSERFAFSSDTFNWSDLLFSIDNLFPSNSTDKEKDYFRSGLETIVTNSIDNPEKVEELHEKKLVNYKIVEKTIGEPWDIRYVIVDVDTKKVIDDAQGYGYVSKESAKKAAWFKFRGGRSKIVKSCSWWSKNKKIFNKVFRHISKHGLWCYTDKSSPHYEDVLNYARKQCKKNKVEGFEESFLKSLHLVKG